ncbi:MAG: M28 family peptidase [Acidobacteriota bacterium]
MKKQLFSFLVLLSFVFSISAQKAQQTKPDLVEKNLRKHVSYLASDRLEGRRTGEKGATTAAGYIMNAFANFKLKGGFVKNGKRIFFQTFPYKQRNAKGEVIADAKEVEAYNVIGILEGTDPVLKNEAIVIGAHYDHLGRGGMGSLAANSTEVHHGADDNASGTSALIEVARQFAQAKNNKRTMIFIAFGGEEEGLLGSRFYVNNPVFPIDKTVAMINMDMVGRLNGDKLNVGGIGTASEMRSLVEKLNGTVSENQVTINAVNSLLYKNDVCCVRVSFERDAVVLNGSVSKGKMAYVIAKIMDNVKLNKLENRLTESDSKTEPKFLSPPKLPFTLQLSEDGFGPSDHASFYGKQIPVLFFFTGTHLDYHKPSDTSEKINYEGLNRITVYVSDIIKAIDSNPKKPTYLVAKSATPTDSRRSSSITLGTIPGYADGNDGMLIDGVRENTPASKIGLKAGDKIIKLAGKDIRNVQDYTAVLSDLKADTEYEIVVIRGTGKIVAKIIPAARK